MNNKYIAQGILGNDSVYCKIEDLNAFLQANGKSEVWVEDENGQQMIVRKNAVMWEDIRSS